jgi:RimJ/RimL family protein N-acetyltransferase
MTASTMPLRLTGCTVRPWRATDAPELARIANDRGIWLNLRDVFPHPYKLEDAERFLGMIVAEDPMTSYAIDVDGNPVGSVGFRFGTDIERVTVEIGYWIGASHRRKGFATEVVRSMTGWAIARYGLTRVNAHVFVTNLASARVLERCGFVREATMRRSAIKDGQVLDQWLYGFVPEGRDVDPGR